MNAITDALKKLANQLSAALRSLTNKKKPS